MRTRPIPPLSEEVKAKFAGCYETSPDGCWHWTKKSFRGYGAFSIGSKTYRAHRIAYVIAKGPIPDGLVICHACDNPPCVNPDHLWVGTQGDNVRDAVEKGRMRPGFVGGPHQRLPFRYRNRKRQTVVRLNPDGSVATCRTCGHLRTDDYRNGNHAPSRCAVCQQARDLKIYLARTNS